MRVPAAIALCALAITLSVQRGSASHRVVLVSPVLGTNVSQFLECQVANADDAAHSVTISFFDPTGAFPIVYGPFVVPPHGSMGVSTPGGTAYHCQVDTDGTASLYRGSVDVIEFVSGLTRVVATLPMQ